MEIAETTKTAIENFKKKFTMPMETRRVSAYEVEIRAEGDLSGAEDTVYHGWRSDIFIFTPTGLGSGLLTYDLGLTMDCIEKNS